MASRRRSPFLRALAALRDAFRDCKAPAAVIGGVAVIARGVARHTADIDATVWAFALDLRHVAAVRERDLDDAERLLVLHGDSIDLSRVRATLRSFAEALDGPDRLRTLADLTRRLRRDRSRRRSR